MKEYRILMTIDKQGNKFKYYVKIMAKNPKEAQIIAKNKNNDYVQKIWEYKNKTFINI